jgi:hypothetical protein
LLIVNEFPAIAFGGASAANLFEMVRFHGDGLVVTAQSYAGLGADADRMLGAAAGLILHQCAALSICWRVTTTERGMGQVVKEYAGGESRLPRTRAAHRGQSGYASKSGPCATECDGADCED